MTVHSDEEMNNNPRAPAPPGADGPGLAVPALRGLLELARLSLRQPPLTEVLDAVARTVSEALGFATVVINVYRPPDDAYEVITVHGSERARRLLLGNVTAGSIWEPLLDPRFARRDVFFIPAGELRFEELDPASAWYTPEMPGHRRGRGRLAAGRRSVCADRGAGRPSLRNDLGR